MTRPLPKSVPISDTTKTFSSALQLKTTALPPLTFSTIIPQTRHDTIPSSPSPPVISTSVTKPSQDPHVSSPLSPPVCLTKHKDVKFPEARIIRMNQKLSQHYGTYPTHTALIMSKFGRPSREHSFTSDVTFDHVLISVYKSGFLSADSTTTVSSTHPLYRHIFRSLLHFTNHDFSPLSEINKDYSSQTSIPDKRKRHFIAAILHYDFRISSLIRYLGNNYTNAHLDPSLITRRLRSNTPPDVIAYVLRALTIGAPSRINGHSSSQNFWDYKRYGNHASINTNLVTVRKNARQIYLSQTL